MAQAHLGSVKMTVDTTGTVVGYDDYYPYGMQMSGRSYTSSADQRYKFTGKELDATTGLDYFGARYYDSWREQWLQVDPLADKYLGLSPYEYCANDPLLFVDPNGLKWFKINERWVWHDGDTYQIDTGKKDKDGNEIYQTINGVDAVIIVYGSRSERLGKGRKINGAGAIVAWITVLGPTGENDIQFYKGFTLSSNYEKYGTIADGEFNFNWEEVGKHGKLKSHWAIEHGKLVPALDGKNPNPDRDSDTQKDGIYLHSSNRDGSAGGSVSTGCILINPVDWPRFNKQLGYDMHDERKPITLPWLVRNGKIDIKRQ